MLSDYCWRMDEYSSHFNKYYIKQDKYAEFMQTCISNETIISLHSSNYARNDTSSLYPTRIIHVKNKTNINLQAVLTDYDIPFSNIVQSRYNNLEYAIYITNDEALYYSVVLYETGLFDYSEPDFVVTTELTGYEDNEFFFDQWAVHNPNINMHLLQAWNITTGHSNIKVAVIDNGVDINHSDLVDNLLEGYDAVQDSTLVCCGEYENNMDWHGTCCAGIIGAANNEIGIVGVAHTSKIIPIRYGHHVKSYHREPPDDPPT